MLVTTCFVAMEQILGLWRGPTVSCACCVLHGVAVCSWMARAHHASRVQNFCVSIPTSISSESNKLHGMIVHRKQGRQKTLVRCTHLSNEPGNVRGHVQKHWKPAAMQR